VVCGSFKFVMCRTTVAQSFNRDFCLKSGDVRFLLLEFCPGATVGSVSPP